MKIYLLQNAPEQTDSREFFDINEWTARGVSLVGNSDFIEYKSAEYERAEKSFTDYNEYFISYYKEDKGEFLKANFPALKQEDGEKILSIFEKAYYFYNIAAEVLTITTGKKYIAVSLCGCCQSDWIRAILPEAEADNKGYFEAMFFNTGTEYTIREAQDGETVTPDNFFDGEIYGDYFIEWSEEAQKKIIAERYGINTKDIKIFKIAGSYTAYNYAEV